VVVMVGMVAVFMMITSSLSLTKHPSLTARSGRVI
jgi:hypothetical protein